MRRAWCANRGLEGGGFAEGDGVVGSWWAHLHLIGGNEMTESIFDKHELFDAVYRLSTMSGSTGGLLKRIDENRQILELIKDEAPDFFMSHKWIEGWLGANDSFFTQLQQIMSLENGRHGYPRPWPGEWRE